VTDHGAIPIDAWHLALCAAFVVAAGAVSLGLRLGLEKKLAIASARTVVQLLLIGYVLGWIFALERPFLVLVLLTVMVAAASRAAIGRSSRRYAGASVVAFVTLALTGLATTLGTTELVIGVSPWWRPQYVVPLLGMVLGNGLTGISLCLDELLESLDEQRARVETELALGATRWEAARGPVREAIRRGMIPILNSMMVVGIVSLPGMMTGQILAGSDPMLAVAYQIVVMFMLAASTALGSMMTALLVHRRLFNAKHQLMVERIVRRRG
jgi:putative ABC transport system permease protein